MLFSEELMVLTFFFMLMVPTGTDACPFWNWGGFVLSCAASLCRLVKQLSGTDIQNHLLLSLGPLGLAWIFLGCPQDLWSDLSVRETEICVWARLRCHVEVRASVPESLGYSIQTAWHSHQENEAPCKSQLWMLFFKVMVTAGDSSCSL